MVYRNLLFLFFAFFLVCSSANAETKVEGAVTFQGFMEFLAKKYPDTLLMPKDAGSLKKEQLFKAVADNMAAKGIHYLDGVKGESSITRKDFINLTYAFITGKQGNSYIENKLFLKDQGVINKKDVGVIKHVEGKVVTYHENSKEPVTITGVESLLYKDTAETSEGSKIEFEFDDMSVLTLGEDTAVEISQLIYDPVKNTREILINLHNGRILADVTKTNTSQPNFTIKTATAVIGIRGTTVSTDYDEKTKTTGVIVVKGTVSVKSTAKGSENKETDVNSNGTATITPNGNTTKGTATQEQIQQMFNGMQFTNKATPSHVVVETMEDTFDDIPKLPSEDPDEPIESEKPPFVPPKPISPSG